MPLADYSVSYKINNKAYNIEYTGNARKTYVISNKKFRLYNDILISVRRVFHKPSKVSRKLIRAQLDSEEKHFLFFVAGLAI